MDAPYRLVISEGDELRRTALVQEGKLLEYYQEEADADGVVGTVYLGRVERVLPDVKAAFIRIGLKQNGFLPLKEAESYHRTSGSASLMSGQDILVQAKKAPKGSKGAFLTRDISLPGQYVLVMPCNRFVGLSKRITDDQERERGRRLGETIAAGRFGVIVRQAALFVSEQEVSEEAEELWKQWTEIFQKSSFVKAPAVLHREVSAGEMLLRDYGARHEMLREDDKDAWRSLRIDEQLRAALSRRVELSGGGSLIIDEREALQTIDVNSGSAVKASEDKSLQLEENLRAVPEIARQIRLRNLSGIIMIDFIDMDTEEERRQVMAAMEEAVRDDRVKNVIHGFTRLGLLEMTRKRTGESLRDLLTIPCSNCCETGRVING